MIRGSLFARAIFLIALVTTALAACSSSPGGTCEQDTSGSPNGITTTTSCDGNVVVTTRTRCSMTTVVPVGSPDRQTCASGQTCIDDAGNARCAHVCMVREDCAPNEYCTEPHLRPEAHGECAPAGSAGAPCTMLDGCAVGLACLPVIASEDAGADDAGLTDGSMLVAPDGEVNTPPVSFTCQ